LSQNTQTEANLVMFQIFFT